MTSATPMAAYSSRSVATSGANSSAPGLSKGEAGTQLLAQTPNVNGRWSAAAMSAATPGMPKTLAISWGSAATAVVPSGSTVRTNSSIHNFVDSRCMCASTRPAVSAAPSRMSSSRASRGPQPATTPSAIARSVVTHSRLDGDSTRPPRRSRSAGASPRATARTWGDDGARAMQQVTAATASSGSGSTRPSGGHRGVDRSRSPLRSTRALPTRPDRPYGPGDRP